MQILRNNLRPHLALLAVLAIYLAVTLSYGVLTPLGEGPDETAHVELIRFIEQKGHLPQDQAERKAAGYKSDWPMLYHVLIGATTRWVNYDTLPELKVNGASPRSLLIEDGLPAYALVRTEDELPPYQGIVLLWHLARLVSALLSAATLVVIYFIALTVYPGNRGLALGVTAVTAAIPRFHFIASVANDDNLLGLLMALFTLALLRAWQQPRRLWTYAWLGLWLGLAITTKYSVVLLPLLVVVMVLAAVRRGELDRRSAIKRLLLFSGALAIAVAWWFVYLEWYFNEIKTRGLLGGLLVPLISIGGPEEINRKLVSFLGGGAASTVKFSSSGPSLWDWTTATFQSFWFMPERASDILVTVLSLAFLALCCLAMAGLLWTWRRRDALPRSILFLLALEIGLTLPIPTLRFYLFRSIAETAQGRHILFPAAAAVGLLLTAGAVAWLPAARRRLLALALAGGLLAISLVAFFGFMLPAWPPMLPVRTSTDAAQDVPNPVHALFDGSIELVGYQVGAADRDGMLPVTLIWRGRAYADQDYLVRLSLLDRGNQIHSLWLGQPVDGHYPTRAWEPGDVVRDADWLPLAGVEAGDYHLELRLCLADGTCLPLKQGQPGLYLADVTIPLPTGRSPTHAMGLSASSTVGFDVWQAGQPAAGLPVYRYRAAIPITLSAPVSNSLSLVGPDGVAQTPQAQAGSTYIFLVGARWPSGEYRLRMGDGAEQIESESVLRVSVRPRSFDVPPMATEVRANFGGEMMLLGYDFPERRTQPGGSLPITLYWQALRPTTRHYIVFNHLLGSVDLQQWGGRDRVPKDYYSTLLWMPGEVVRDDFQVPVSPDAPHGVYRLDVGAYVVESGTAWPVPLVKDGKIVDANSVTIAPIKVGGPPPDVIAQQPKPQVPRADHLGDAITLLGYDLQLEADSLNLTLYWRCDARLPADYTTFVHVRRVDGKSATPVAQMDRPPAEGAYPTSLWDPGEVIRDVVRVPMPAQVPPGDYEIVAGLYEFGSGVRLPVTNAAGKRAPDDAIVLTTIAVGAK